MESTKQEQTKALINEIMSKPDDYWKNNGDVTQDGNTSTRLIHTGDFENSTTF